MRQIFVFTAGNPEARQHLVESVQNPVDDEKVFDNFDESHHEELKGIRDEADRFYAWGAVWGIRNVPTWEQMERDDFVLCVYDGIYRYVARLLAKYDNPECARAIWGTNDKGRTWRYMYFLTKPIKIYQPVYEYEGYLHSTYRGFTRIVDTRLEEIEKDYGSIEEFIKETLQYEGEGLPGNLESGPSQSEKIAEESLQVDDVTHGIVNEGTIPDSEGRMRIGLHASYERSPKNRERAIAIHGTTCAVCTFNFDEIYGKDYADGYIQIHHIKLLSEHKGTRSCYGSSTLVRQLPRHGPQEEDQRDVHRGAKSPNRSGKQMKTVFAFPPPKLSPPLTARRRPRSAGRRRRIRYGLPV